MKLLFLKPDLDKIETNIRLKIIEFFQLSIEKIASIFFNYPEVPWEQRGARHGRAMSVLGCTVFCFGPSHCFTRAADTRAAKE